MPKSSDKLTQIPPKIISKRIFKTKKVVRKVPAPKEKAPPQIKIDMVKKFIFRCFQNRLKTKRQEETGYNYYYREKEYNQR